MHLWRRHLLFNKIYHSGRELKARAGNNNILVLGVDEFICVWICYIIAVDGTNNIQ